MTIEIHAQFTAGITDLKKDPMGVMEKAEGEAVAILNRNTPVFYCVPAEEYARLLNALEDHEFEKIAKTRESQKRIRVNIEEL